MALALTQAPYRNQALRDLAWLITSPHLMSARVPGLILPPKDWLDQATERAALWLRTLDDQSAHLNHFLHEDRLSYINAPRLGHYAERLIEFWIAHDPVFHVLAARRSVVQSGKTLGDLDIVFACDRHPAVHWEVAVKFYLRAKSSAQWSEWIGPNPRDRMDQKIERVISHQLPLGTSNAAIASIGSSREPLCSEAFLKGWLFYPADDTWRTTPIIPNGADVDHNRGWWIRQGEGDLPQASRSSRYCFLDRMAWMSPVHRPDEGEVMLSAREATTHLASYFARHMAARLVCEVQRDEHGWWKEIARGFVVHPRWPEIIERAVVDDD